MRYAETNEADRERKRIIPTDRIEGRAPTWNSYTVKELKIMARYTGIKASVYNHLTKDRLIYSIGVTMGTRGWSIEDEHLFRVRTCCRAVGNYSYIEELQFMDQRPSSEMPGKLEEIPSPGNPHQGKWESKVEVEEIPCPFPTKDELTKQMAEHAAAQLENEMKKLLASGEVTPNYEVVEETPEEASPKSERPSGVLEGALFDLVEASMKERIEKSLSERGLTKEGVERVIEKFVKTIDVPRLIVQDDGKRPEMVHPSFESMMKLLSIGEIPYLYGPAGSGKTHGAGQFATLTEREVTIIPCNKDMDVTDLTGYNDMRGDFVPTAFYKAFTEGHAIVIDEADKAPGTVLVFLNSPIQQRVMMFANGIHKAHKDVVFIFTGNTRMSGASSTYSAGQKQDNSLTNRLEFVTWDYDKKLETKLTQAAAASLEGDRETTSEWLTYVRQVRKKIADFNMSYIAGPRQSIAGAKMLAIGMDRKEVAEATIYGWMRPEDARRVQEVCGG